jgi:lipopolysaccharide/colanic/teichoic acid biosynthesis glycosyltransferase
VFVLLPMSPQQLDESGQSGLVNGAGRLLFALRRSFYAKHGKRALDVFASAVGLIALSPVFLLAACCIKLMSCGPVFYRQVRLGKNGRQFRILKFRSMVVDATERGLGITASGDHRITAIGRILRRYKIDELPQLCNVLRGDMSLVGPRPELPVYVDRYTPQQYEVLSVRPGITDPASLFYRDEERLLQESPDPERLYCETILPHKLALNLEYIANVSLANDILLMLSTIKSLFFRSSPKRKHRASA